MFNILVHAYGDPVTGARVLDLFAGTGALGLEALSRGAAFALFVDEGAEARALIRENVAALGLGGASRIFRRDATRLGAAHPLEPFSLCFLDPPYRRGLAEKALASARAGGWLAPSALIVVEEAAQAGFAAPDGFDECERRVYDDTALTVLRIGREEEARAQSALMPASLIGLAQRSISSGRKLARNSGLRRSGGTISRPSSSSRLRIAAIVEGVAHRFVELAHDRLRRSLREEEGVPARSLRHRAGPARRWWRAPR